MNWRRYDLRNNTGFVRILSEDLDVYEDHGEVVLIDSNILSNPEMKLVTRWIIRIQEYYNGTSRESSIEELKEDFQQNYNKDAVDMLDVYFVAADDLSRWSAIERHELSEQDTFLFLKKHGIEVESL